jgi:hypothetical protein
MYSSAGGYIPKAMMLPYSPSLNMMRGFILTNNNIKDNTDANINAA